MNTYGYRAGRDVNTRGHSNPFPSAGAVSSAAPDTDADDGEGATLTASVSRTVLPRLGSVSSMMPLSGLSMVRLSGVRAP